MRILIKAYFIEITCYRLNGADKCCYFSSNMVVEDNKPNPTEGDAALSKKALKKAQKDAEKKEKKAEHKVSLYTYIFVVTLYDVLIIFRQRRLKPKP